jgi:beta-fructofuranosidase
MGSDPHRPQYHFSAPHRWMNDPNGLIHWKGQYHLFYQHNPNSALWGDIHWGHAISDDLVFWRDLPIALAPSAGGADAHGCWSGCAVDDHGTPTLLYTGVSPEVQCVATSSDDLLTWEKYSGNPVIGAHPPGLDLLGFRDPCVWRDGATWYMVLGTGLKDVGGAILLYRSADLRVWEYVGTPFVGAIPGEMWECPGFFPLGDKWVLMVSIIPTGYTHYFVGTYTSHTFTPEYNARLDLGHTFYAPQTFLDERGRRIMIGWLRDGVPNEELIRMNWAGAQSIPRVLTLGDDGRLRMTPIAELSVLRGDEVDRDSLPDSAELEVEFAYHESGEIAVVLQGAPANLVYNAERQTLTLNQDAKAENGQLTLAQGEALRLRIFVDHSVIEIYANDRVCLTTRVYPTRPDSLKVEIIESPNMPLKGFRAWAMRSIWD